MSTTRMDYLSTGRKTRDTPTTVTFKIDEFVYGKLSRIVSTKGELLETLGDRLEASLKDLRDRDLLRPSTFQVLDYKLRQFQIGNLNVKSLKRQGYVSVNPTVGLTYMGEIRRLTAQSGKKQKRMLELLVFYALNRDRMLSTILRTAPSPPGPGHPQARGGGT